MQELKLDKASKFKVDFGNSEIYELSRLRMRQSRELQEALIESKASGKSANAVVTAMLVQAGLPEAVIDELDVAAIGAITDEMMAAKKN